LKAKRVLVAVSVEGRKEFRFAGADAKDVRRIMGWPVEDSNPKELSRMLSGFAKGIGCSVEVTPLSGGDPHHIWESVFRGLGAASAGGIRAASEAVVEHGGVRVRAESAQRRPYVLDTGGNFVNHMLEHIGWNARVNLDVEAEGASPESIGFAVGSALRGLGSSGGVEIGAIDEAAALVSVKVSKRPVFRVGFMAGSVDAVKYLEGKSGDTLRVDLDDFYSSVAQNMGASVDICVLKGLSRERAWDEIASEFGKAMAAVFSPNRYLAGTTTGVKGTVE
jgi:imidazoleglycerol phosphate dehydratase HisB